MIKSWSLSPVRRASVTPLLHRTPTSRAAVRWDSSNFCEAVSEWIPELSCEPPFFPQWPRKPTSYSLLSSRQSQVKKKKRKEKKQCKMYLHAEWKFIKGISWTSIKFSETLNKNIQKWIQTMGSEYDEWMMMNLGWSLITVFINKVKMLKKKVDTVVALPHSNFSIVSNPTWCSPSSRCIPVVKDWRSISDWKSNITPADLKRVWSTEAGALCKWKTDQIWPENVRLITEGILHSSNTIWTWRWRPHFFLTNITKLQLYRSDMLVARGRL